MGKLQDDNNEIDLHILPECTSVLCLQAYPVAVSHSKPMLHIQMDECSDIVPLFVHTINLVSTQLFHCIDRLLISRRVIDSKTIKAKISPNLWASGDLLARKEILAIFERGKRAQGDGKDYKGKKIANQFHCLLV